MMRRLYWTDQQWATAHTMRTEGKSLLDISQAIGCCKEKVRQELSVKKPSTNGPRHKFLGFDAFVRPEISESAMADRDRRFGLRPRDLTASMFGDPLPGYSALDRIQSVASR